MKTYTNPQFPGKKFRRLKWGESIQEGDLYQWTERGAWTKVYFTIGKRCWGGNTDIYYREIHAPEPTPDPSALMLQRIETAIEKLDAVLAKLNA